MKTVNCRHCDVPNPSGSRFCNGCGAPLPPDTNLICPNCETANPQHLLYCDNCGTRLVQDEWPTEATPSKTEPREAFSLPERQPGDTGDLDPNFIPEWLKTGESATPDTSGDNVIGDWLNQLAEQEASGEEVDLSDRGDRPSWLDTLRGDLSAEEDDSTSLEADSQSDLLAQADIPDWLADLSAVQQAEEEAPEDAPLPSWMNSVETGPPSAMDASSDEVEVPAWLREEDESAPATEETVREAATATDSPLAPQGSAADESFTSDPEGEDEPGMSVADGLETAVPIAPDLPVAFDADPGGAAAEIAGFDAEAEQLDESPEWAAESFGDLDEREGSAGAAADLLDALAAADEPESSLTDSDAAATAEIAPGALPQWLSEMRPEEEETAVGDEDDLAALLAAVDENASDHLDDAESQADLSDFLTGDELPTWLEEGSAAELSPPPTDDDAVADDISYEGLPEWLQPEESAPSFDDALKAALDADAKPAPLAPGSIIFEDDLVPDPSEPLARPATIPDWLAELRPDEDSDEADGETAAPPLIPDDAPVEMMGPLAGLRGVVPIEAIIAQPHATQNLRRLEVSPDQARQMALLQQLLNDGPQPEARIELQSRRSLALPARSILALLLLGALLVALYLPSLLSIGDLFLPPAATATHSALTAAAGQPVMIAYDFTPALAGELLPLADALAAEAAANNSPLLLLTQEPTAVGLLAAPARQYEGRIIGYLPGNALGVRYLANCLSDNTACESLFGRSLRPAVADVALIIVVTGDRDNLVNWIEQVGPTADIPLLAAVTQSLGPTTAPYEGSGQLAGVVEGLPALVAYQQSFAGSSGDIDLLRAQSLGQWTAVLLLLVGAIWHGFAGRAARGGQRV